MCGTWSGGKPMNCAATHKAMANASAVDPSAIVVTSPLEKRLPKSPLMAAPASGSNGMIHKCITCLAGPDALQYQRAEHPYSFSRFTRSTFRVSRDKHAGARRQG